MVTSCCSKFLLAPQTEQIRTWPGLIRVHFWQLHFSGLDSAFFSAGFRFPGRPRRSAGSSFLVPVASFFFVDLGVWISWGRFN
jgi:hypothetical protein